MTHLARPPRTTPAIVVELSQTTRAVIEGRLGAVTMIRGRETFHLNDLEAAKLDAARATYLHQKGAS